MLIRQADKTDIPFIHQLQQKWFEEDNVYGFVPEDRQQIENSLNTFIVAEIGGSIAGFISGSIHISDGMAVIPKGENYLEIDNLYVLPEFRNQNIGSSLINQLTAQAKQQGIKYALVYSASKNIRDVLNFYEHQLFQSWYIQMFRKL